MDLDRLGDWNRKLRLFGHNRFSLYGFWDKDHLGSPEAGIKADVAALLRERGFRVGAAQVVFPLP